MYKIILLSSILLGNIFDSWSTYKGITVYKCVELNPLSKFLMGHLGVLNYLVLNVIFTIAVITVFFKVWENNKAVRMLCILWLIVEIAVICNNAMCLMRFTGGV